MSCARRMLQGRKGRQTAFKKVTEHGDQVGSREPFIGVNQAAEIHVCSSMSLCLCTLSGTVLTRVAKTEAVGGAPKRQ